MNKICCFTGYRNLANEDLANITKQVKNAIYELYKNGVDTFITGGALGFDTLAAQYVIAYCKKQTGGSAYTLEYAKKHGKPVLIID